jgi:hypothetical protein
MRVEIGVTILHPSGQWYTSRMKKKKQSFELTFEQTEMLGKFGGAAFDYPKLSFEKVARKLLGPKPFKATTKGKKFEKVCREVFDRERE